MEMEREVGFLELLRRNPVYRRLWFGLSVSMLGEWFSSVAFFVLIYDLTGSELGIGLLFVIRMFSLAFPQVFTGMLAVRFSRKWLMIWSNLLSAVAILLLRCSFALYVVLFLLVLHLLVFSSILSLRIIGVGFSIIC